MPQRRYLGEPKTIAWERARHMKRIPRGVWVEPRVGRAKTVNELGIRISDKGVKIPGRKKPFKSLSSAIRAQAHTISSVGKAEERLSKAQKLVSELHRRVYDNWNSLGGRDKGRLLSRIGRLREILSPLEADANSLSPSMSKALSDLDEAVAEENPGRICAKLVQVHNDITDRRGELRGQLANLPRWRDALVAEKRRLDMEAFAHIDRMEKLRKRANSGDSGLAKELKNLARRISPAAARDIKSTARRRLEKAGRLMQEGRAKEAAMKIREAKRSMAAHSANHSWLYSWRLDEIGMSKDEKFKRDIAARQARLYSENIEYWLSPESHEPISAGMAAENMRLIGGFFPGSEFSRRMNSAAKSLRAGKVKEAKRKLDNALKSLDK